MRKNVSSISYPVMKGISHAFQFLYFYFSVFAGCPAGLLFMEPAKTLRNGKMVFNRHVIVVLCLF